MVLDMFRKCGQKHLLKVWMGSVKSKESSRNIARFVAQLELPLSKIGTSVGGAG